jgi:hypothetical protein
MSSKDSPSSNAGIDLVLEKQRELIAGLIIEDVFVLPSKFQAKSTSVHAEGLVTIDGFVPVRATNLTDPNEGCNTTIDTDAEFSRDLANDEILDLGK